LIVDSLRGPFGANLGAGDAPDLLRVGLEKNLVEPAAEPVRHPLLEILLDRVRTIMPFHVTEEDPERVDRPQPSQGIPGAERIIEEASVVMNAGQARDGDELLAQNLVPQLFDGPDLREEPVAADVEPETLVACRAGQPAHDVIRLEDGNPRPSFLRQLVGGRQTGRTGADDDDAIPGRKLVDVPGCRRSAAGRHTRLHLGRLPGISGRYTARVEPKASGTIRRIRADLRDASR
jgi:hypothetical protein